MFDCLINKKINKENNFTSSSSVEQKTVTGAVPFQKVVKCTLHKCTVPVTAFVTLCVCVKCRL